VLPARFLHEVEESHREDQRCCDDDWDAPRRHCPHGNERIDRVDAIVLRVWRAACECGGPRDLLATIDSQAEVEDKRPMHEVDAHADASEELQGAVGEQS